MPRCHLIFCAVPWVECHHIFHGISIICCFSWGAAASTAANPPRRECAATFKPGRLATSKQVRRIVASLRHVVILIPASCSRGPLAACRDPGILATSHGPTVALRSAAPPACISRLLCCYGRTPRTRNPTLWWWSDVLWRWSLIYELRSTVAVPQYTPNTLRPSRQQPCATSLNWSAECAV